ncbi:hypothetical protein [Tranquillimonas rosea]|uniref:hypothetical protein n=1 Tax=Tranquillimonas rosea TaxID=641238 RepID=UPI003BAB397A
MVRRREGRRISRHRPRVATDHEAALATLIRAPRGYAQKDPAFAASLALHSIAHLLAGRGLEALPIIRDILHQFGKIGPVRKFESN